MPRQFKIELTEVEIKHIAYLLERNETEGFYVGGFLHYWKRHDRIVAKLTAVLAVEDKP